MLTSYQIRAGRALVKMSAQQLADAAGVGLSTVQRMEKSNKGPGVSSAANLNAVQKALESAGVEFIPENGGGAGVRLKDRASPE